MSIKGGAALVPIPLFFHIHNNVIMALTTASIVQDSKERTVFPSGRLSFLGIGLPRSLDGSFPETASIEVVGIKDNVQPTRNQPDENSTRMLFSGILTFHYNGKKHRAIIANALFQRLFDAISEGNLNDMALTIHSAPIPDSDRKGVNTIMAEIGGKSIDLMERHGSEQDEQSILKWRRENGLPIPGNTTPANEPQPQAETITD